MAKPIRLNHEFQDLTFREIRPIPQWSARIEMEVPYDRFLYGITTVAEAFGHRFTGTLTRDPVTNYVTSFTHTRFRRNKHGNPPDISECEKAMRFLAGGFERSGESEREYLAPGLSRIMLGLYEGQHESGARAGSEGPDYSLEDVKEALGPSYLVSPAEVCIIALDAEGKASHYAEERAEELAEVVFRTDLKERAYLVGHAMLQERFSVETFAGPQSVSYMVETAWCREPDPVFPVITP